MRELLKPVNESQVMIHPLLAELNQMMLDAEATAIAEYAALPHDFKYTTDARKGYTDAKRMDVREAIAAKYGIEEMRKKVEDFVRTMV